MSKESIHFFGPLCIMNRMAATKPTFATVQQFYIWLHFTYS